MNATDQQKAEKEMNQQLTSDYPNGNWDDLINGDLTTRDMTEMKNYVREYLIKACLGPFMAMIKAKYQPGNQSNARTGFSKVYEILEPNMPAHIKRRDPNPRLFTSHLQVVAHAVFWVKHELDRNVDSHRPRYPPRIRYHMLYWRYHIAYRILTVLEKKNLNDGSHKPQPFCFDHKDSQWLRDLVQEYEGRHQFSMRDHLFSQVAPAEEQGNVVRWDFISYRARNSGIYNRLASPTTPGRLEHDRHRSLSPAHRRDLSYRVRSPQPRQDSSDRRGDDDSYDRSPPRWRAINDVPPHDSSGVMETGLPYRSRMDGDDPSDRRSGDDSYDRSPPRWRAINDVPPHDSSRVMETGLPYRSRMDGDDPSDRRGGDDSYDRSIPRWRAINDAPPPNPSRVMDTGLPYRSRLDGHYSSDRRDDDDSYDRSPSRFLGSPVDDVSHHDSSRVMVTGLPHRSRNLPTAPGDRTDGAASTLQDLKMPDHGASDEE